MDLMPTLARLAGGTPSLETVSPDQLALVQFSSGTTSDPKPVALSHRALIEQVRRLNAFWPDADGVVHSGLSWLPLYHDMGLIGCVFPALERPGTLTLIPPELFVARPAVWLRAIDRLPAISVMLYETGRGQTIYLPVHPGDPMVEATRRLRADGRDVFAILGGSGPEAFRRRLAVAADRSAGAVRLLGAVGTEVLAGMVGALADHVARTEDRRGLRVGVRRRGARLEVLLAYEVRRGDAFGKLPVCFESPWPPNLNC